jgi:hypothetical protein
MTTVEVGNDVFPSASLWRCDLTKFTRSLSSSLSLISKDAFKFLHTESLVLPTSYIIIQKELRSASAGEAPWPPGLELCLGTPPGLCHRFGKLTLNALTTILVCLQNWNLALPIESREHTHCNVRIICRHNLTNKRRKNDKIDNNMKTILDVAVAFAYRSWQLNCFRGQGSVGQSLGQSVWWRMNDMVSDSMLTFDDLSDRWDSATCHFLTW